MAKGRVAAKELKRDPLMDQYLTTRSWVQSRSRPLVIGLTVTAVVAAAILIFWMISSSRDRAASESLADAFKVAEATVANPIPPNVTGYAFASEDEKNRKAYEAFEKVARDYPSYYGDLARYCAATYQLKFDATKAEATLKDLAQRDSTVAAQARLALAQRYAASGRLDDAVTTLQQLKSKPGDVAPLLIDLKMAEVYEAQGKIKEAIELYFSIAKTSRSAGVGTMASTRLAALDPARLDQLPPPEPTSPFAGR